MTTPAPAAAQPAASPFASDFAWGVATAAYQIEGAPVADGKGPSVWDDFVRRPGKIYGGHTGDRACEHYRRWPEDVALLRDLGAQAYRLSVSWPRVLPSGTGAVNQAGLDFYDRLVDALLAAGVQPWLTLYHWDTPLALYDRGHWLNPEMPAWFADYATILARRLGDRVKHWITLNEPQCFVQFGLKEGVLAPGDRLSDRAVLLAWKHALLAHGAGVRALRASAPGPIRIGCAPTGRERIPFTDTPEDVAAARAAYWALDRDLWSLPMWWDPMLLGRWPAGAETLYGAALPALSEAEGRAIAQPIDFLGYNAYSAEIVRAGPEGRPEQLPAPPGHPKGALDWLNLHPDCLYWAARFQTERFPGLPFVITENGFAGTDWPALDGSVPDGPRIDWLARHLAGLERAAREGFPVAGYFHWTLLDNFEWAEGYRARFGLVHVDFETQRRTPKASFAWYRDHIRRHSART